MARSARSASPLPRARVFARMNLDRAEAETRRFLDEGLIGIEERRNLDPSLPKRPHDRADAIARVDEIEAALCGHLFAALGHKAHGVGPKRERDLLHLGRRRHLHVDARLRELANEPRVAVLYVPPVLAQMKGDLVGAPLLGHHRGRHGIGLRRLARLADRRDVVDVDSEPHSRHRVPPLATVIACLAMICRIVTKSIPSFRASSAIQRRSAGVSFRT